MAIAIATAPWRGGDPAHQRLHARLRSRPNATSALRAGDVRFHTPPVIPKAFATRRPGWWLAAALLLGSSLLAARAVLDGAAGVVSAPTASQAFAARIERLSEPSGYFDTDNLISNESSYLHVIPALEERRVIGGTFSRADSSGQCCDTGTL